MGYGLLDIGNQTRQQAMNGLKEAARLEDNRELANRDLKARQKQATMSNVGTGAGLGFMIGAGTAAGGPIGAVIGAGLGFLGSLF